MRKLHRFLFTVILTLRDVFLSYPAKQIEKDELLPQGLTLCKLKWRHASHHCPCALSEAGRLVSACPLCF